MVFITVEPFLDSFNSNVRVEPLDSRLYLSLTFTFKCMIIVIRNRQYGNTGRLNRNLYVMLKFTEWSKTPGIPFPEENKLFACDFVLIWIKQTLIWFNLQRDGTRNGLSNIKETFAESLQLQMSVLHQRMSIFQSSMLVSQVHIMAGQNVKKKLASYVATLANTTIINIRIFSGRCHFRLQVFASTGEYISY